MDRMPGNILEKNEAAYAATILDAILLATDLVHLRLCQAAIHHLQGNVYRQTLKEMVELKAAKLEIAL